MRKGTLRGTKKRMKGNENTFKTNESSQNVYVKNNIEIIKH